MSGLIFTIPINVRSSEDNSGGAYPPPDASLADVFAGIDSRVSAKQWDYYYLVLFSFIFYGVEKRIKYLVKENAFSITASGERERREQFASQWKAHLEDRKARDSLYNDIACVVRSSFLLKLLFSESHSKYSSGCGGTAKSIRR